MTLGVVAGPHRELAREPVTRNRFGDRARESGHRAHSRARARGPTSGRRRQTIAA